MADRHPDQQPPATEPRYPEKWCGVIEHHGPHTYGDPGARHCTGYGPDGYAPSSPAAAAGRAAARAARDAAYDAAYPRRTRKGPRR